jgi:hypothetical protein
MNLHQFSHNNNIEIAVMMKPRNAIKKLANFVTEESDLGTDAQNYFQEVIDHSDVLFKKTPQYEPSHLGFKETYKNSIVEVDRLSDFFKSGKIPVIPTKPVSQVQKVKKEIQFTPGFCIRTGKAIPFNPQRPMCDEAWKIWNQLRNANYPEKYCHYSGELSNGKTSYSKPIMRQNWNKARS